MLLAYFIYYLFTYIMGKNTQILKVKQQKTKILLSGRLFFYKCFFCDLHNVNIVSEILLAAQDNYAWETFLTHGRTKICFKSTKSWEKYFGCCSCSLNRPKVLRSLKHWKKAWHNLETLQKMSQIVKILREYLKPQNHVTLLRTLSCPVQGWLPFQASPC